MYPKAGATVAPEVNYFTSFVNTLVSIREPSAHRHHLALLQVVLYKLPSDNVHCTVEC